MQANLGFLKVLVAKLPSQVLQVRMKSMVEDLLNCQVYCETPLKAKVVALITNFRLISCIKFGLCQVAAVWSISQILTFCLSNATQP